MLGNNGKISSLGSSNRPQDPWTQDEQASLALNDFIKPEDTSLLAKLAQELKMTPEELKSAIDSGKIDPQKLTEAFNKVTKEPGVETSSKLDLQKAEDRSRLGEILNTVAEKLDFPNFDSLINALPDENARDNSTESIVKALVDNQTNATQSYAQLKPPGFNEALSRRRLDQAGKSLNTAA
jgi:hypothetical protein